MKLKTLQEIIKKKETKNEFAIVTNLSTGESEIFEENKKVINVAVTGAKSYVYNDNNLANALTKNFSTSVIDNIKVSSSGMNADIHASADYRANMVKVFAKKAVEAC